MNRNWEMGEPENSGGRCRETDDESRRRVGVEEIQQAKSFKNREETTICSKRRLQAKVVLQIYYQFFRPKKKLYYQFFK